MIKNLGGAFMKNAKLTFLLRYAVIALLLIMFAVAQPVSSIVLANHDNQTRYYDNVLPDGLPDATYQGGQGQFIDDSYEVYYDELVISTDIYHPSVPSISISNSTLNNTCAPLTGRNIISYYDRFYPELIPNYEPGLMHPVANAYVYYPNRGLEATETLLTTLHTLMNSYDGTTSSEFKDGLEDYVNSKGRNVSYTSFYSSATSVNFTALANAISQNKVAMIMCGKYNYVGALDNVESEKYVGVVKHNSLVGHMMMVYGYTVYDYYVDGVKMRTDTFLCVASSYSSGEKGHVLLYDDDLVINEAYIVNIS